MTSARRGPRVRRGSARSLLSDAARDVFGERGYRATTREIADRAGVSPDLIFRYFDTKEGLFFDAVVTPLLDAVDSMYRRGREDPSFTALTREEVVHRFTAEFFAFASANLAITRAMTHLFTEGSDGEEVPRLRERVSSTLAAMVTAGGGTSSAARGLQIRFMTLLVGAVATFLANTYRTDDEVPDDALIVAELTRFICAGIELD